MINKGQTLRRWRQNKGYSLTYVADKLGVSYATLSNYERGKTSSNYVSHANHSLNQLVRSVRENKEYEL